VNPSTNWPFFSEQIPASKVTIGDFILSPAQIARLGNSNTPVQFDDNGDATIKATTEALESKGYAPF